MIIRSFINLINILFTNSMTSKNLPNSEEFSTTDFEQIVKNAPGHVYWKDKNGVYLGCNLEQAKSFGFNAPKDVIGKSDFEILDHETASVLRKNDIEVMNSKNTLIKEEFTEFLGKPLTFLSHKTPLIDAKGEVVGILGVSLDITKQIEFAHSKHEEEEKTYHARLFNIPENDRDFLKSKTCILPISLEQDYHEGKKFRALLRTVNFLFKGVTIVLCDSLHRHSLAIFKKDKSAQELYDYSLKLGDEWLERNKKIIEEELKIPYKINRWNYYLRSDKFEKNYNRIRSLYLEDANYQNHLSEVIKTFFIRSKKHDDSLSQSDYFEHSKDYLLEEYTGMLEWLDEGYDFEVYPSIRDKARAFTFDSIEPERIKFLIKSIGVKFEKEIKNNDLNLSTIALENIINTLPGHVYWKNRNGVLLGCNLRQAENLNFENSESIIGKSDFDLYNQDIAMNIRQNDLEVIRSRKTHITEEDVEISGQKKTFLSHKTPLKSPKGDIIGILGVSLDITKQKELERKLQMQTTTLTETVHAKDRFLNNVSHEIRTPLHVIGAMVDELSTNYHKLSDSERIDYINFTKQATERLSSFVNNILEAAKGKKGELTLKLEKADIAKIANCIVSEISVISKSSISIKAEEGKYFADCTKYQIEQVVRNLLTNAIRYGKETPIEVIVRGDENNVIVEVADQGIGVPEKERLSIFEAFEESSRTKTMAGGTGLGLAICKDIINLHNGKIWVESKNNVGSEFIFTLPINQRKQ